MLAFVSQNTLFFKLRVITCSFFSTKRSIYSTTELISVLEIFCEILLYETVDIGLLVSLLVVKLL